MFAFTNDETNHIINVVSRRYGIDLSVMALASLRLKLSQFCRDHSLQHTESLATSLLEEPDFMEQFIPAIHASSPDMFRDPELWITLRDRILPEIIKHAVTARILIPDNASGEEIYSMAILLKESKMDQQIRLTATCRNESLRKQIDHESYAKGRFKCHQDNYAVFHPGSGLDKYFVLRDGAYFRKPGLLENVELKVAAEDHSCVSPLTKLIIFRNRMLYLNRETSQRRISTLLEHSDIGTILIIGIKESIKHLGLIDRLHIISSDLNIYSKQDET